MALVLGIVFLDEPLTIAAVTGLALVLLGVALGSGLLRPARRREPAPVHAP
jgi:drug/metabolite transporter (DMT)-like permease